MDECPFSDKDLAELKRRVMVGGPEDGLSLNQSDQLIDELIACRAELARLRADAAPTGAGTERE